MGLSFQRLSPLCMSDIEVHSTVLCTSKIAIVGHCPENLSMKEHDLQGAGGSPVVGHYRSLLPCIEWYSSTAYGKIVMQENSSNAKYPILLRYSTKLLMVMTMDGTQIHRI
jgi:hypothetical protein